MYDSVLIRLRLLGDIVFTIPAIHLYRRHFPDQRLLYVVEERFREAAELIPGIDGVLTVPSRPGPADIIRFRKAVRDAGCTTAVDFHSGPTSAILTYASGVKVRLGYRTPNRNWAYNHRVIRHLPGEPQHSVANQCRLLEPLGIPPGAPPPYPPVSVAADSVAPQARPPASARHSVVLHLGAGNRFRDWGLTNFSSLAERLLADGCAVLLIGGGELERSRAAALEKRLHAPLLLDLTGQLGIRDTFYLISQCSVYCGADSGPLHLASLTATPLVALYGPNIPAVSGPWRRENVTILEIPLPCRPCSQHSCEHESMPCMGDITVDHVHQAILAHLR